MERQRIYWDKDDQHVVSFAPLVDAYKLCMELAEDAAALGTQEGDALRDYYYGRAEEKYRDFDRMVTALFDRQKAWELCQMLTE